MYRKVITAAALAGASASGLVLLLGSLVQVGTSGLRTPDEPVTLGVLAIGVLLLAWYLVTAVGALACLAARAAGRAWFAGEQRLSGLGAPLARRLLLTGGSAAVAAAVALSPAAAAPIPVDLGPVVTLADDLGWGADEGGTDTPEPTAESTDPWTSPEAPDESDTEPTPTVEPASATDDEQHTVSAGDSLWTIAADHLTTGSTAADISAAWPSWYAQNRDLIGDDPDLIHPGQVLTAPDHDLEEQA